MDELDVLPLLISLERAARIHCLARAHTPLHRPGGPPVSRHRLFLPPQWARPRPPRRSSRQQAVARPRRARSFQHCRGEVSTSFGGALESVLNGGGAGSPFCTFSSSLCVVAGAVMVVEIQAQSSQRDRGAASCSQHNWCGARKGRSRGADAGARPSADDAREWRCLPRPSTMSHTERDKRTRAGTIDQKQPSTSACACEISMCHCVTHKREYTVRAPVHPTCEKPGIKQTELSLFLIHTAGPTRAL